MKKETKICKKVYEFYNLSTKEENISKTLDKNASMRVSNAKSMCAILLSELLGFTNVKIAELLGYSGSSAIHNKLKSTYLKILRNKRFKKDYEHLMLVCETIIYEVSDLEKEKIKLLKEIEAIRNSEYNVYFAESMSEDNVVYAFDYLNREYKLIDGVCGVDFIDNEYKKRVKIT